MAMLGQVGRAVGNHIAQASRLVLAVMAAGASFCAPSAAIAGGFYIDSLGTPASLGTAGAGNVTNTFGPDATWANPAGLVWLDRERVMSASGQVLDPVVEFDPDIAEGGGSDGGDAGDTAFIPSFFYAQELSDDWSFGFGVAALQGGGVDYGNDFVGRYSTVDVQLTGIGATWSVGHRVNDRLSIGVGGTLVYSDFEQTIAVNQGAAPDAQVEFRDLDDLGVQPIIGLQYEAIDGLIFGLTWRGEFDAELEGNVRFKDFVLPLPSQRNLDVDWTNPQWLEAGVRYRRKPGGGYWLLSANWQEWSEFSDNRLAVDTNLGQFAQELDRDWDDTWRVAFGYLSHSPGEQGAGWSFGVSYESSVVDDDDRTADLPLDSTWTFSGAYGRYDEGRNRGWSVAGTVQVFGDGEIDETNQGVRYSGDFDDYYVVFLGGTYRF